MSNPKKSEAPRNSHNAIVDQLQRVVKKHSSESVLIVGLLGRELHAPVTELCVELNKSAWLCLELGRLRWESRPERELGLLVIDALIGTNESPEVEVASAEKKILLDCREAISTKLWSSKLRRDLVAKLGEWQSRCSIRVPAIFCTGFERLADVCQERVLDYLRDLALAAGIRGVVVQAEGVPAHVDTYVQWPRLTHQKYLEDTTRIIHEACVEKWQEIARYLLDGDEKPALSDQLKRITEEVSRVFYPRHIDVGLLSRRLQDLRDSLDPDNTGESTPSEPTASYTSKGALKGAHDALHTLLSRTYFLLLLEQLEPKLFNGFIRNRDGASQLFRLQLAFNRMGGSQIAPGLLNDDWKGFLDRAPLRHLWKRLSSEDSPLVEPFPSAEALIQHGDWIFGGRLPYFDEQLQSKWEKWLTDLKAWADHEHGRLIEQRKSERYRAKATKERIDRLTGQLKIVTEGLEKIARFDDPRPEPETPDSKEILQYMRELRSIADRALHDAQSTKRENGSDVVAQELGNKYTSDVDVEKVNVDFPEFATIDPEDYGLTDGLVDPASRMLQMAELIVFPRRKFERLTASGTSAAEAKAGKNAAGSPTEHWSEQEEKMLNNLCRMRSQLGEARKSSSGNLAFELGLVEARMHALLGNSGTAERLFDELKQESFTDELKTVLVNYLNAYLRECYGQLADAERDYLSVSESAYRLGAIELSVRCAVSAARCKARQFALDDLVSLKYGIVKALVTVGTERSPRLAHQATKSPSVFVSFRWPDVIESEQPLKESSEDDTFLGKLRTVAMSADGQDSVWLDYRQIDNDTQDFSPMLMSAVMGASAMLFLFSPRYFESRWCLHELDLALAMTRQNNLRIGWAYVKEGKPERLEPERALDVLVASAEKHASNRADADYFRDRIGRVRRLAPKPLNDLEAIGSFIRTWGQ